MQESTYQLVEIYDSTAHYKARLNINEDIQHNRPTSSQITMNSKYPFHIHNGQSFYYSGNCTATFIDNSDCYIISDENIAEFYYKIAEWLHNDHVKYLKYSEKTIFPIGILETIKIEGGENGINDKYNVKVSFDWEQIANTITLY